MTPWRQGYRLADGSQVPSVTTIIGRFKSSNGLIHWAWKEGLAGRDYRETRDSAAEIGTIAHAMIEAELHGSHFTKLHLDPGQVSKARVAFEAFLKWRETVGLRFVASELSLVSERWRYGGTFDALLAGKDLSLVDFKTSRGVYPDFVVQLAAYAALWEENNDGQKIGGVHIVHLNKETGEFTPYHFKRSQLRQPWETFKLMRRLYELDKELQSIISQAHCERVTQTQ